MNRPFRKASAYLLAFLMAGLTGLSWVGGAQATFSDCGVSADNFQGADGCTILDPLNGNVNDTETLINAEGFFGVNTWTINGSTGSSPFLSGDLSGQGGSFQISGLPTDQDALVIIKDGAGTNLVGYLYNADANDGPYTWTTPFTDPPFTLTGGSESHDVSHFTLYFAQGTTNVPEPASALLLGVGLMGIGLWRRFRNQA